jgi:hypothetical protein
MKKFFLKDPGPLNSKKRVERLNNFSCVLIRSCLHRRRKFYTGPGVHLNSYISIPVDYINNRGQIKRKINEITKNIKGLCLEKEKLKLIHSFAYNFTAHFMCFSPTVSNSE